MAEILGIGATHYPPGLVPEEFKPWPLVRMLNTDPRIPERMRDPANWPEPMRVEWGDDEGITSQRRTARVFTAFRKIREEIDAFHPDFILSGVTTSTRISRKTSSRRSACWRMNSSTSRPTRSCAASPTSGASRPTRSSRIPGTTRRALACRKLPEDGIDMSYAYKPCQDGLGHAFANTLLYLDLDRKGFNTRSCRSRSTATAAACVQGGSTEYSKEPDPPSPSPRRCFEMGQATARALKDSPWRVVIMASSSWSHAFLTEKNHWIYPDLDSDRAMLEHLRTGNYRAWRDTPLAQMEAAGQQEVLNWTCLAGAMAELDYKADILDWVETWTFNAPKCLAVFKAA
jgi:hypothetical protein